MKLASRLARAVRARFSWSVKTLKVFSTVSRRSPNSPPHRLPGGDQHLRAALYQEAFIRCQEFFGPLHGFYKGKQARHQGRHKVDVPGQEAEGAILGFGHHLGHLFVHQDFRG